MSSSHGHIHSRESSSHGHSHGGEESSSHGHSHGAESEARGDSAGPGSSASDLTKIKIDKTRIFLLFSFVLLDVLGFSILLPLLPYICAKFGASPSVLGMLFASNAIAQLISAPTIGLLSDRFGRYLVVRQCLLWCSPLRLRWFTFCDLALVSLLHVLLSSPRSLVCAFALHCCTSPHRVGRKKLLLICSTVTCVSFVWLFNAESLQDVYLSRILDGLLGGNISLAQAYVVGRSSCSVCV
jgi:MFS family permease